jgi:lipopolysaccharide transport system ATP-binding protein
MYLRLAFSLAVHVNADILVIDEALAVGHGTYVKKCIDRIWEMRNGGTTILFCSHSLYTVTSFCDNAFWIREGLIHARGNAREVVSEYEEYLRLKESEKKSVEVNAQPALHEARVAEIVDMQLLSRGNIIDGRIPYRAPLDVSVSFEIFERNPVQVGFAIDRIDGLNVFADTMMRNGAGPLKETGRFNVMIHIPELSLLEGKYRVVAFLLDESGICIYDQKRTDEFVIRTAKKEWGVCYIPHEWKIDRE